MADFSFKYSVYETTFSGVSDDGYLYSVELKSKTDDGTRTEHSFQNVPARVVSAILGVAIDPDGDVVDESCTTALYKIIESYPWGKARSLLPIP